MRENSSFFRTIWSTKGRKIARVLRMRLPSGSFHVFDIFRPKWCWLKTENFSVSTHPMRIHVEIDAQHMFKFSTQKVMCVHADLYALERKLNIESTVNSWS